LWFGEEPVPCGGGTKREIVDAVVGLIGDDDDAQQYLSEIEIRANMITFTTEDEGAPVTQVLEDTKLPPVMLCCKATNRGSARSVRQRSLRPINPKTTKEHDHD
jgi:hypothetical protein